MRKGAWAAVIVAVASVLVVIPTPTLAQTPHPPSPGLNAVTVDTICGDVNYDGRINMGDVLYLVDGVFKCGPAPQPWCLGDLNGDGTYNIGDAVYLLDHIFRGGPPPVPCCLEAVDRTTVQRLVKCGG